MGNLSCSNVCRHAVIAGILTLLPATSVLALKAPEGVIWQPAPAPSKPSEDPVKKSRPAKESGTAPAAGSSPERVRADSAVSFPVDI